MVFRDGVQETVTLSPLREADKSVEGRGNSRAGGEGAPGVPHALSSAKAHNDSHNCRGTFIKGVVYWRDRGLSNFVIE
jgi:hypothetical protein